MVKSGLIKFFDYFNISQLENFLTIVEDVLGGQLAEYLAENYLVIASEVMYNISLIIVSRIAYKIWNTLLKYNKPNDDKPLTIEYKTNPITVEYKTHPIKVEYKTNPIIVEFKENLIEEDYPIKKTTYTRYRSRITKRVTKRSTKRQIRRCSRR